MHKAAKKRLQPKLQALYIPERFRPCDYAFWLESCFAWDTESTVTKEEPPEAKFSVTLSPSL